MDSYKSTEREREREREWKLFTNCTLYRLEINTISWNWFSEDTAVKSTLVLHYVITVG